MRYLLNLWQWLLGIIFPALCVGCERCGKYLCEDCRGSIGIGGEDGNLVCCASYDRGGVLARLVMRMKYGGVADIADELITLVESGAERLLEKLGRDGYLESGDEITIVPVPIGKRRLRQRGFNQAELLARGLERYLAKKLVQRVEVLAGVLEKADRPKQSTLGRGQRLKNLRGAITMRQGGAVSVAGKVVVLIDDVATTLSTLKECEKVVAGCKPKAIYLMVLARARSL